MLSVRHPCMPHIDRYFVTVGAVLTPGRVVVVVFRLDEQLYALRLSAVTRILRSVEIVPLPRAPDVVLGVVNVQGHLTPVVDVRGRLGLPPRALGSSDHFILAQTGRRAVVLIADVVPGVIEREDACMVKAEAIAPGLAHIEGALKLEDGLIFIHDLSSFLSLEEEHKLAASLREVKP